MIEPVAGACLSADEVAAVDGVRAGWNIEDDVLVQATAIGASMSEADKHRLEKLISQLCDPTDGCPAEYYRDAFPIQYSVAQGLLEQIDLEDVSADPEG